MSIMDKIKTFSMASLLGISSISSDATENHQEISPVHPVENTKHSTPKSLYSYIPTSVENYHEICQKGLQALANDSVPEELKNLYIDFIKFYNENKEKNINLNDPMVRKSFLAFKKIAKYEALNDFSPITPSKQTDNDGRYNEFSKLLGIDAKSFHQTVSKQDPNFIAFCDVLYKTDARFYLLSKEDAPLAEPIANRLLEEKLTPYNIAPKDTTFDYCDFKSAVFTYDVDNKANNWNLHLLIEKKQLDGSEDAYCPLAIIKAHELGHIMQKMPGTEEDSFKESTLAELAPTIELIVMQDIIYKEIHNIPLNQEVIYPQTDKSPLPNLGKIANTFRSIKEKHNLRSYEDVLLTKEASVAINQFTQNLNIKEIMDNIKKDKELDDLIKSEIESSHRHINPPIQTTNPKTPSHIIKKDFER